MKDVIRRIINDSIEAKQALVTPEQVGMIEKIASRMVDTYRTGGKVVAFGNGGSASDAQHLVAELVCRFEVNRRALPAIAFTANSSVVTSIGNDFSYNDIFKRQVEALVLPGDMVIGITTSGKSPNVISAFKQARLQKASTVAFTGANGAGLQQETDICWCVPSKVTGRIQECHILAVHIICKLVEDTLFGQKQ